MLHVKTQKAVQREKKINLVLPKPSISAVFLLKNHESIFREKNTPRLGRN